MGKKEKNKSAPLHSFYDDLQAEDRLRSKSP